jgi:CxxC-x17-CxxC domain-containing protein
MHKATCSDCGKTCEVPFKPTGEKPVFCSDCFSSKREGGRDEGRPSRDSRDFGSRPAPRSDYKPASTYTAPANDDSKRLLSEIAAKLENDRNENKRICSRGSSSKICTNNSSEGYR